MQDDDRGLIYCHSFLVSDMQGINAIWQMIGSNRGKRQLQNALADNLPHSITQDYCASDLSFCDGNIQSIISGVGIDGYTTKGNIWYTDDHGVDTGIEVHTIDP